LGSPAAIADFQQFRGPVGGEKYLEEQSSLGQVGKITHIKTNGEPYSPLKGFDFRKAITSASKMTSKSSCTNGIIAGIAASLFTKNPLPLLVGLSGCFPSASAQQKVGGEFQVNNYTNETQSIPSVTGLNNNSFVVAWTSGDQGVSRDVYGQIFHQNGSKIGNTFQLNTYSTNDQTQPYVTDLNNGNFVAAWTSDYQDGDRGGVYGQIFADNSSKIGNEFQINSFTTNTQSGPSIANLDNGNFVTVWSSNSQDGSGYGVYGQLFSSNASKIGNEFRVNTFISGWQWIPSIASLSNSHFVVTWAGAGPSGGDDIHGQLFANNGTKIGSEFQINPNNPSIQSHNGESAARINDGFVEIWHSQDQDGSGAGVYGQLFSSNASKIGSEFQVNTYINNTQSRPSVASFSNGNFVVAWHSETQDGDGWGAYGQLFNENATKIGNEFQVHTNTTNDQKNPSVAFLQNGNFVVTWGGDDQAGNLTAVFGQIFHDNITYPPSSTSTSSSTSSTSTSTTSSTKSSTVKTTSSSSSDIREILLPSSNPNNRFLWLWLLLGITGGITCLGLTGYYLSKKRRKESALPKHAELDALGGPAADVHRQDSRRDSEYSKLSDLQGAPTDRNYANRPQKDRDPEYANRPKRADRESQYANAAVEGSESSETDIVPGEF